MSRSGLLLLAAVFVAGGLAGFVVGAGSGVRPPRGPDGGSSPPPRRPDPTREETPDETLPALSRGEARTLASVIAALPDATEFETGDGVIEGTVRTQDGRPLSGVLIRCTPRIPWTGRRTRLGRGHPEDEPIEEAVRKLVRDRRRRIAIRREAVSDASGAFRLTGLPDRECGLGAWLEGYMVRRTGSGEIRPGSTIEMVASPLHLLAVRVLLPDGTEPEKARMRVRGDPSRGHSFSTWRPRDPWVELKPGTHKLRVSAGEHEELASEEIEVTVAEGTVPAPVEMPLVSRPCIIGKVVFPEGEQRGNCQVKLLAIVDGTDPEPARLVDSTREQHAYSSRGSFSFRDLTPGPYLIGIVLDQREIVTHERIEVGNGPLEVELTIPAPDAENGVVVDVLGPDGERPESAQFRTSYRAMGSHSGGGSRVHRRPDGTWLVGHHVPPESYPKNGEHGITASIAGLGSRTVWYDRDSTSRVTLAFENAATLRASILGYAGSGLEGRLELGLLFRDGEQRRMIGANRRLDEKGVQTFGPFQPGEGEIVLSAMRQGRSSHPVLSRPLSIRSGENEVAVPIPKLHRLTVILEGIPVGTTVRLKPMADIGWWGEHRTLTESGRVVYEMIPLGEYSLEHYGPKREKMFVRVTSDAVVRFAPAVLDALRVDLANTDGGMARAGLRDGDLVVAIGGKEIKDLTQAYALLNLAVDEPRTELVVLRGGRRITIAVKVTEIWRNRQAGGSLVGVPR